jgi:SAM-dependent methyltransferase
MSMPEAWLRCPECSAPLFLTDEECLCGGCGREFPVLLGIPDLRVTRDAPIDFEKDRRFARDLAAAYPASSFEDLVAEVWKGRPEGPAAIARRRIGEINRSYEKHARDLGPSGWLGPLAGGAPAGACLEVGCGTGTFLHAALARFPRAVGVDLSLAWLVIAKKRLEEHGLSALLLCAFAESLPLAGGLFDLVVSLDLIEHVSDPAAALTEIRRVARPGGATAFTTPNRFSLAGEPHVGIWGVGFLPRRWMPGYVRRRTGMPYEHVHPMSLAGLRRLFRGVPDLETTIQCPAIAPEEAEAFSPVKRAVSHLYNRVLRWRAARSLLLPIAPFFQIVARRRQVV